MKTARALALTLTLLLGFAAIWRLQIRIDAQHAALLQEQDSLLLTSPRLLKTMSLEYAPLLADIYWTRAVQYYGEKHANRDSHLDSLWPLLDITTTLDPNLLPAYRFGAMFLSEPPPQGAGRPDLAVQLIERGIQANPEYWRLYEDLGFVYYFDMKDYAKASAAFYEGSQRPHADLWMRVMAARVAAEGESFETSSFLWQDVYQNATDPQVKEAALSHLQLLKVREDCKQLDSLGDIFEKRYGRRPERISQLIETGILRAVPVDPLGYRYEIGEDGKAQLSLESPLLEKQLLFEKLQ
jgi:hypothetical protein